MSEDPRELEPARTHLARSVEPLHREPPHGRACTRGAQIITHTPRHGIWGAADPALPACWARGAHTPVRHASRRGALPGLGPGARHKSNAAHADALGAISAACNSTDEGCARRGDYFPGATLGARGCQCLAHAARAAPCIPPSGGPNSRNKLQISCRGCRGRRGAARTSGPAWSDGLRPASPVRGLVRQCARTTARAACCPASCHGGGSVSDRR